MTRRPVEKPGRHSSAAAAQMEAPSRKRSGQVALLLMGTMAIGSGAYALMPSEHCDPNQPAIAGQQQECRQRSSSSSSSGSHYSGSSGSSWGSSGSNSSSGRSNFASNSSSSGSGVSAASSSGTQVARSGFGSFGSHFSGGG